MTTFCVAYQNKVTIDWAEKTGHAAGGWVRISDFLSFDEARRLFDIRKDEYTNSAVGMFAEHGDGSAWSDRRPRYLANRHILFSETAVRSAFGDLINSRSSDWF